MKKYALLLVILMSVSCTHTHEYNPPPEIMLAMNEGDWWRTQMEWQAEQNRRQTEEYRQEVEELRRNMNRDSRGRGAYGHQGEPLLIN